MAVAVSTPVFEGPFDLLLHLITNSQLDIHEVSLTSIVAGFVSELEKMGRMDLEVSSEFLLIAAILVQLKAKRLLPAPEGIDIDEEVALWEERDLLLSRLLECKTFKDVALVIGMLAERAERSAARRVGPDERFAELVPDPLAGTNPKRLRDAFVRVMAPKPRPVVDLSHLTAIRISLAETVEELCRHLPRVGSTSFRRLTAPLAERIEVVVHFLAILELYKQGLVDLHQPATFGDLRIEWIGGHRETELAMAGGHSLDAYEG